MSKTQAIKQAAAKKSTQSQPSISTTSRRMSTNEVYKAPRQKELTEDEYLAQRRAERKAKAEAVKRRERKAQAQKEIGNAADDAKRRLSVRSYASSLYN